MIQTPFWLIKRTRLLNVVHFLGFASAYLQMNLTEKLVLGKYAKGKKIALEIGTFMGVSANIIAKEMVDTGKIYCVDPFFKRHQKKNPGLSIAERDLKRNKLFHKVIFLIGLSTDSKIKDQVPTNLDFIFVDGDHSYEGLFNDWGIVKKKLSIGGIVCLHDTIIPLNEQWRKFGSVLFYNDIIMCDREFQLIETAHSMTILRRLS